MDEYSASAAISNAALVNMNSQDIAISTDHQSMILARPTKGKQTESNGGLAGKKEKDTAATAQNQKLKTKGDIQEEDFNSGCVDERQRLIQQNKQLKQMLKDLATTMQTIIAKDREYRSKPKGQSKELDVFEQLANKKQKLVQHQIQVHEMKANISYLKKQLDTSYEFSRLLEKEEELKGVRKEYQAQIEERDQLLKQKQIEQSKNVKYSQSEEEYEKQMKILKDSIKKVKEENKELTDKLSAKEKALKKLQDVSIAKDDKIRDMNNKIKERNKILENSDQSEISDEVIADLTAKIKDMEAEKKKNESKFAEEIIAIQKDRQDIAGQYEKKVQLAKEKERVFKLNHIKLKEIAKLIKSNANHVLNYSKKSAAQIEDQKSEKLALEKVIAQRLEELTALKSTQNLGNSAPQGQGK